MKKLISLAIALFFATTALAQEMYNPSQVITAQVVSGALEQTVILGDNIEQTKIAYTKAKGMLKADGFTQLGLSASCTANESEQTVACTVSGQIKRNLVIPTEPITPYIIVEDEDGDVVFTQFAFNLKARPTTLKIIKGESSQSVIAGEAISDIQIEFAGIKKFIYSGKLPTGIEAKRDDEKQIITVSGKIDEKTVTNVYKFYIYGVKSENENDTLKVLLTFDVSTGKPVTVSATENKTQKVIAGDSIKPVVFSFTGANDYKLITVPPGKFSAAADASSLTVKVWGLVAGNTSDGMYTIEVEVTDGKTSAKAQASVEVESKSSSSQSSSSEENPESSSSVSSSSEVVKPESSSSAASSSSIANPESSSSEGESSSSETTKPASSSSVKSSSSEKTDSSSSKETSSSSETTKPTSSSSEKATSSSSAKSSSSENSTANSSSSEKSKSSSSTAESSSSSKKGKSSSSEKSSIIASVAPTFEFGFANNELTIVLPKPAMLRVQVFDMMGHSVESFAESVATSKSYNLAHLNKGNYVVRIESARYARTAKILVK